MYWEPGIEEYHVGVIGARLLSDNHTMDIASYPD